MDALGKILFRGDWKSYFWMRESFHFVGGAIIGLLTLLVPYWWTTVIIWVVMNGILIWKEVKEDKVSQTRFKTLVDLASWNLGISIVAWAKFV